MSSKVKNSAEWDWLHGIYAGLDAEQRRTVQGEYWMLRVDGRLPEAALRSALEKAGALGGPVAMVAGALEYEEAMAGEALMEGGQ